MELIDQSSSFGILLPETPDFDVCAAAEALISVLWTDPKVTGLLSPALLPADIDRTVFPKLTSPTPLLKEFIISVDTGRAPIGQLRYEKPDADTNRIDIILTPKTNPLGPEHVSFREGAIRCDALIAIGIPDIERLANITDFPADFFTENKIVNMDISQTNTAYGEANLIDATKRSYSELVWQILAGLPAGTIEKRVSTLLLAGILAATRGLAENRTAADTFGAVAELLRLDADLAAARRIAAPPREAVPLSLLQLYARAAVRSRFDQQDNVLWSFLTLEDFAKTNRTQDDIPGVFAHVRTALPESRITVLVWQDPSGFDPDASGRAPNPQSNAAVRAALAGDQAMVDGIAAREAHEPFDHDAVPGAIRLREVFASFRDAEDRVRSLIRHAL